MASLAAIGIVSGDIAASCRFYRAVGVEVGEPTQDDDHFEATLPNGLRLMFDTEELIRKLDPEGERPRQGHAMVLAFECANAEQVHESDAKDVGACFTGKTEPFDAFWGQRYATVVDPDG